MVYLNYMKGDLRMAATDFSSLFAGEKIKKADLI
jgi:hypothetical protein